jgi:regulator of cell morphogenesis and NO signaling
MSTNNINDVFDLNPQSKSLLSRYNENAEQQEELAFFQELVTIFSSDKELPIEQLKSFSIKTILQYLRVTHNYYLNKQLPELELAIDQLSHQEVEVPEYLVKFMAWVRSNMEKHFRIEEQSLFPYVEMLEDVVNAQGDIKAFKTKFKDFTVERFEATHDDTLENQLDEVKKQIVKSFASFEKILPYRILIQKMDALEKDLRLHARIEDEVLVPKAQDWEKQLG